LIELVTVAFSQQLKARVLEALRIAEPAGLDPTLSEAASLTHACARGKTRPTIVAVETDSVSEALLAAVREARTGAPMTPLCVAVNGKLTTESVHRLSGSGADIVVDSDNLHNATHWAGVLEQLSNNFVCRKALLFVRTHAGKDAGLRPQQFCAMPLVPQRWDRFCRWFLLRGIRQSANGETDTVWCFAPSFASPPLWRWPRFANAPYRSSTACRALALQMTR
jgi:hypothetical protein